MRPILRTGIMLLVGTFWIMGVSDAQQGLTKRDLRGPVWVEVTLTAPPAIGGPVRAKIVLDTHSVALDGIDLSQAVTMRVADGAEVAPTAVEAATGSGHHREAVLVFPPVADAGTTRILVKNIGGVAERSFSWELPQTR